jgi:DNA-binding SARP family transcriptional activator/Leucine-rich repeat (LRR) protein
MTHLKISLLGPLQVMLDEEPVTAFESDKVRALLAYLAVEADHPHRRETLAGLFWPERPERSARHNLSQALSNLRKAIGDSDVAYTERGPSPFFLVTHQAIQFNRNSNHSLDATVFAALLSACEGHGHSRLETCQPCICRLREAVALYRGPFLEQFYLGDSPAFEEWVLVKREGLQRQVVKIFPHLVAYHEQRGEYQDARGFARRQVELEPWDEAAQRQLIRTLALSGQRSAALKQYQVCRHMLTDELGVEPAQKTTELFEQIRDGKFERPEPPHRKPRAKTAGPLKSRPFRLPVWVMVSVLILVLSLGLLVGSLKPDSNQTAIDSKNPSSPSPTIIYAGPNDAQTAIYSSTGEITIPQTEYQALVTLYNETAGSGWKEAGGWLSDSTPCTWFGVTCSRGSVVELNLPDNNLSGNIPPQIGQLTSLHALNLEFNQLRGSIPPELGGLSDLESLSLVGNSQLSGMIPPELGHLTHLRILTLSRCGWRTQLSGSIPPELGNLTRLVELELCDSLVSGPIPSELGNLTNLVTLNLENNRLSGSLPPELGNLTHLHHLYLSDNLIGESIPSQLGNLSNLTVMVFTNNQLSGPLPPELGNLVNLESLALQGNQFLSGPIPPEIGRLSNLRLLDLNSNQFSGNLPTELGNLSNLRTLIISWNPLSGPLPISLMNLNNQTFYFEGTDLCEPPEAAFQEWLDSIHDLQSTGVSCQTDVYSPTSQTAIPQTEYQALVTLYNETGGPGWKDSSGWLSDFTPCVWFGVTCSEGAVTELNLPDNDLSGNIPPQIGQLTNLSMLDLGFNRLSGDIPPELGSLSALRYLILAGNTRLSGTIPPELGDLTKLEELILSSPSGQTQLTGSIPPQLGNLKRLMLLDLSNSMVSDPIPPELGNLGNLMFLDLSFNRLSGPIPPEMGNLSNLRTLTLYGNNQLGGPIPPELGDLVRLELLILSNEQGGTKLSGPIPPELGNLRTLRRLDIDNCLVSGPIPPELGNLTDLTYLDLWRIPLSGPIPPELGNLVNLETFSVGGIANELEGPLPLSLMNLKKLSYFTYGNQTDLCEPPDPAFQEWLNGIRRLDGPRVLCQSEK